MVKNVRAPDHKETLDHQLTGNPDITDDHGWEGDPDAATWHPVVSRICGPWRTQ